MFQGSAVYRDDPAALGEMFDTLNLKQTKAKWLNNYFTKYQAKELNWNTIEKKVATYIHIDDFLSWVQKTPKA